MIRRLCDYLTRLGRYFRSTALAKTAPPHNCWRSPAEDSEF